MSEEPEVTATDIEIAHVNETFAIYRKRLAAKTKEELRMCDEELKESMQKREEALNFLVIKALLAGYAKNKK